MSTTDLYPNVRWTAKGTAFKIWSDINKYVDTLTHDDPELLQTNNGTTITQPLLFYPSFFFLCFNSKRNIFCTAFTV